MARKKTKEPTKQELFEQIVLLFKDVAEKRNLLEDVVIQAFLDAVKKTVTKFYGGDGDTPVDVEVTLNEEEHEIRIYYFKNIVSKVEDDALEISVEEVEKLENKEIIDNRLVFETILVEQLSEAQMKNVDNQWKMILRDLEKEKLIAKFSTKIGELVTGQIENISKRTVMVNLGDISVPLDERRHTINNEKFADKELVPFVILEVVGTPRGANIIISRTDPLFVRRLMEREITEIYDGTVLIRNIVREPGERCKVAVESTDINVDPVGACIGPSGSRIQKVTAELGPANRKEKIDIIPFNNNAGIYIMDAFLPAEPIGIEVNEEEKKARVVFHIDDKGKALGHKGGNIRMASALTGYELEVFEQDEANELGIAYKNRETLVYEQNLLEQERAHFRLLEQHIERETAREEETLEVVTEPEVTITTPSFEELLKETEEEKVPVVEEVKEEPVKVKKVKTTISLAELEAELEKEKEAASRPARKARRKHEEKVIEKEEEKVVEQVGPKMDIYTEEELAEIERMEAELAHEEHEDDFYDDIDYDEFDEYYDN